MELVAESFLATWLIGALLYLPASQLTRGLARPARVAICAFVLAIAFTPSIVLHHTSVPAPAILVLVMSPYQPMYGWSYALLFGALPIALLWAAIACFWPRPAA